jgi:hypothetical protein
MLREDPARDKPRAPRLDGSGQGREVGDSMIGDLLIDEEGDV